MSDFVLDCSITMSWCFEDESDVTSTSVLDRLSTNSALVPSIWPLEVANVLAVAHRRRRISRADAERFLALLEDLPIVISGQPQTGTFFRLAVELQLSSYDAAYVELAVRHGLPLATNDAKLMAAAGSVGLALLA